MASPVESGKQSVKLGPAVRGSRIRRDPPPKAKKIAERDPEVLLLAPCGFDLSRSVSEAERVLALESWRWARGRRIAAIDGNVLTSRPGPRIVRGVEVVARILDPGVFSDVPLDPHLARLLA